MERRFVQFITRHRLFNHNHRLIVAVSGGADSMVLLWLLHHLKYDIIAVHCNFNLRPGDCDLDQQLVERFCQEKNIPCRIKSFDTVGFARENSLSLEMAARQLRYQWFEEIRRLLNADYILTAHHSSDNVETVMLNIVRGAGLKGLTGIKIQNNHIVRPLLWASSHAIRQFALLRQIPYRIDHSNHDISIPRNKIRHQVVPLLENLNPSFLKTMQQNLSIWNDWFSVASSQIDEYLHRSLTEENDKVIFRLLPNTQPELLRLSFFTLLQKLNYSGHQASDLLNFIQSQTGTVIKTSQHQFIKDRDKILIIKNHFNNKPITQSINAFPFETHTPFYFKAWIEPNTGQQLPLDANVAMLDFDNLELPLVLRRWQPGDRFFPLGLSYSKKVSDFLTDRKIPPYDKQNQWILTDQQKVIWIIGQRIDNRCKVTSQTQKILRLTIIPSEK
ncbi:MAG TPA: tRNA lysidine(34) synthetase TilS [Salinivirgaceae bacterium]|nr:tRNA lysidine(34) synthetase TilS [Salinivirgaceae bacterium]